MGQTNRRITLQIEEHKLAHRKQDVTSALYKENIRRMATKEISTTANRLQVWKKIIFHLFKD